MFKGLNLNVDRSYALASIYFLGNEEIGRRKLAERLGLTESRTRTMLEHLRDAGFVKAGDTMELTTQGEKIFSEVSKKIQEIEEVDLENISMRGENIAALLRDVEMESSIKVRDEAVRGGAHGMTILTYREGFEFPEEQKPEEEEIKAELDYLKERFDAGQGDKLLISSAKKIEDAKSGLWSAVAAVLDLEHLDG
jgi:Mn-dependent DtxR family transcriptional regulator